MVAPSAKFKFLFSLLPSDFVCWVRDPASHLRESGTRDTLPDLWGNIGGVYRVPHPGDKYE